LKIARDVGSLFLGGFGKVVNDAGIASICEDFKYTIVDGEEGDIESATTNMGIASGCEDFRYAIVDGEEGYIKRATAEIVYDDPGS
jgi:hypothetical protein